MKADNQKPTLQDAIDDLLSELVGHEGHTPEYAAIVKQLDLLYKMKALDNDFTIKNYEAITKERISQRETEVKESELAVKVKELEKPDRVSKDVLATIAANIAAVALVIGYERAHVVTTKALSFIMKR